MNSDSQSATPVGISSPFPTRKWASNSFDALKIFTFPSNNQIHFTFSSSSSNSKVTFNHVLNQKFLEHKTNFRTQQILQFYTSVEDAFIWAKFTSEVVRIQMTHKNFLKTPFSQQGRWKFYASYSATRQVNNLSFKIGALWQDPFSKNFADVRFRFNKGQYNNQRFFYSKGGYTWNEKVNIGGIIVWDLKRRLLQKNDVKLGYEINKNSWVSLQLQNETFRNFKINQKHLSNYFETLRLNYIYRLKDDKWKAGLRYEQNLQNLQLRKMEALIDYNNNGSDLSSFKAKVGSNRQLAVATTYSHSVFKTEIGLIFNKLASFIFTPSSIAANIRIGDQ